MAPEKEKIDGTKLKFDRQPSTRDVKRYLLFPIRSVVFQAEADLN